MQTRDLLARYDSKGSTFQSFSLHLSTSDNTGLNRQLHAIKSGALRVDPETSHFATDRFADTAAILISTVS